MSTEAVAILPENQISPTQNEVSVLGPFELNEPYEAEFRARRTDVYHKLRKPTLQELMARDAAKPYRSRDVGNDEEEVMPDTSGRPEHVLYDKLVLEVRGYSEESAIFENLSEDERAKMLAKIPTTHKSDVIRAALDSIEAKVEYDENDSPEIFIWGEGNEVRVKCELGRGDNPYVVTHTMREPSERQMQDYRNRATRFTIEKGTKKPVTKVVTNLIPAVELYNALVVAIEGATYDGQPVDIANPTHLGAVDAYQKRAVVDALLKETQLDLGN
jgi:hypothetical protein